MQFAAQSGKDPKDNALFEQHLLTGKAVISAGEAPTPYHIHDGYGALIGGVAVKQLLKDK